MTGDARYRVIISPTEMMSANARRREIVNHYGMAGLVGIALSRNNREIYSIQSQSTFFFMKYLPPYMQ